ncbi:hypothetical protein V5740_01480 [Croceibacterium sp. TMG7-5b_MA50]|uniref:hypothetical protein n=1 Tax=Croceibacterium sp. TMG7-5b_MA50 TaxID=3121290 RepID=UPI003222191C
MNRRPSFRGQPLLLLAGLVVGWGALRVASWEAPWPALPAALPAAGQPVAPRAVPEQDAPVPEDGWLRRPLPIENPAPARWRPLASANPSAISGVPWQVADAALLFPPLGPTDHAVSPATLIGSEVLMLAGLSHMQVPDVLLAYLQPGLSGRPALAAASALQSGVPQAASPAGVAPVPRRSFASRWSGDGWLLLREDTDTPLTSARPSYGRSQAGAVVRYRLGSATNGHAPQAYLRGSTALAGAREQEVAAGLSLRPIPGLPVRLAAEARVNDNRAGTDVRPAVFAVTELPPVALPGGTRGELYLQGGYAGGDFATGFVDGQARLDRPLLQRGGTEVSIGAGAWGGAQKGSERLDVGPSAGVTFGVGRVRARVAADYRLRVAGNAEPASGPALTIAAGF